MPVGCCGHVLCSFFLSLLFASVSSGNSGPAGNLEAGKPSSLGDAEESRV